jgi:uncharacterized protein
MDKVEQLLTHTTNRVYPLPERKWKYYQEWHDTLFFHWKVAPSLLEKHIPAGVELDTLNGMAWVTLVAFKVKKMRLRNMPPLPYVDNFHEINVRTYVTRDGIPGIFMFSIETDKFIQVLLSRLLIGMPYKKADIKRSPSELTSHNNRNGQGLSLRYSRLISGIDKKIEDVWLTERHCLYEDTAGTLYRFDIHHKEWKLQNLVAVSNFIRYTAGDFSLDARPDRMYYSKKIKVVLWGRLAIKTEK